MDQLFYCCFILGSSLSRLSGIIGLPFSIDIKKKLELVRISLKNILAVFFLLNNVIKMGIVLFNIYKILKIQIAKPNSNFNIGLYYLINHCKKKNNKTYPLSSKCSKNVN